MSIKTTTRSVRAAAVGSAASRYTKKARRRELRRASFEFITATFTLGGQANWYYRNQLWPFWVLGILILAGWGATLAPASGVLMLAVLASAGMLFHLRQSLDRRAEQVYALSCLAAMTGWLTLTSALGPERIVNVLGVLAWAVAAVAWWKHHPVGRGKRKAASTGVQELWVANVSSDGQMKGATLPAVIPFEHGSSYTVQLVPGKQHIGMARANLPLISSGLRTPLDRLIIEQHPEHPKDPTLLRMQVIENSPIEQTVWFDKPRHDNGRSLLGPYGDGVGEATWRIYTPGSMWGGFVLGGIGSGKTRLIESIALTALDMGNTVIFYIDGQDGASSPTLFKHATWSAGADGAMRILGALERIMHWRNKENRARGLSGFTPSAERPGIFVIIDEAHAILTQAAKRWLEIVRTCRKLGIGVLAADQNSGLPDVFGGEDALRANLLSGNGLGLRTNSRIAGALLPGLEFDLYDLPVLPGFGYTIAAKGSDARTAPFRGRFLPDEDYVKEHGAVPVPTVEEWFSRYPALELDRAAARAAGEDYLERHERAEEEQLRLLSEVNGEFDDEGDGPLRMLADLIASGAVQADDKTSEALLEARRIDDEKGLTCAQQIMALRWDRYQGEMERAQIITELTTVAHEADTKPPDISTVRKALSKLVDDGALVRTSRGNYQRPGRAA